MEAARNLERQIGNKLVIRRLRETWGDRDSWRDALRGSRRLGKTGRL